MRRRAGMLIRITLTWVAWSGLAAGVSACGTARPQSPALKEQQQRVQEQERQRALDTQIQTYRHSLQVFAKANRMTLWGLTQYNLGKALLQQGLRATGAERQRLVGEAAEAFRQALQVRTREQRPHEWAETQFSLGLALQTQGMRSQSADSRRALSEAAQAYRAAQEVWTREQQPGRWICAQWDLAQTLRHLGAQLDGADGDRLLAESVAAFRLVLQFRAQEPQDQQRDWRLQTELGISLHVQGRRAQGSERQRLFDEALQAYRLALREHPDTAQALSGAVALMQEERFLFDEAHELLADWVRRHPQDVPNQANFAESNLTTGRFAEAARLAAALLSRTDLEPDEVIAVRVVELCSLALLNQTHARAERITQLREAVAARPEGAGRIWRFEGIKEYLRREPRAEPQRAWLLELIAAVENLDRRAAVDALNALGIRAVP